MSSNKNPWILVSSSMLLLIVFVAYWLMTSYIKEKHELNEDMKTQLQLAYTEVKESDVADKLTYFFKSSESDSLGMKSDSVKIQITDIRMTENGGEQPVKFPSTFRKIANDTRINTNEKPKTDVFIDIIDIQDSLHGAHLKKKDSETKSISFDSINANTRFQFPNYSDLTNKDFNAESILEDVFSVSEGRSEKIYALFSSKLETNKLPTQYSIVKDRNNSPKGMRVEYTSESFGLNNWAVDVDNIGLFILKKMLPIIFFSVFLIGIVGLAFWTLMHNYIKQQLLVKVKTEFINNMTHELKTPLATISVALEAISGFDLKNDTARTKEYINISRHEVSRLSLLVDKVLSIAVFDREDTNIRLNSIRMNEIIDDVLDSMKIQSENKNAIIQFHNTSSNSSILGDSIHLTNVVYNILDNALKYSNVDPKIDIVMQEDLENVIITIQDNGKGIPKEYIGKIFDRFFRVPTSDQHDVKGHGLGLSYVKDVIQKHNGNITVESKQTHGTKFIISIPKK